MDPAALGSSQWSEIGKMLTSLWAVALFVVLFAANMLLGHNLIPSMVASRHIPESWQRVRPVFYALAILSFVLAVFFIYRVVDFAGVLRDFWPNYWI